MAEPFHRQKVNEAPTKLLFVCSRNQWRSPTAEMICRGATGYQTRSAGTEAPARVRVNVKLLAWADWIFCMERRHVARLRERFGDVLGDRKLVCLDIPDEFPFMDPELVKMLEASLTEYLPDLALRGTR